ncbi:hypothetical protein UVI_02018180 [Ustilaginoidea virens]|nr:hypothetical protein UVI_02018180 [Ustilaginoidea virens]
MDLGSSSYVVRLSDMANIWEESLERKGICMRGWSENISIDPSDTAENMATFLSCLRSALDPDYKGHHTTDLTISPANPTDAGEDGLTIKVTCRLPGFEPFRWPMHLSKQPPSTIGTALVLPLIQAYSNKMQQVGSLIHVIKQKDAVLTKLMDKIEAMGTGLEHVFTGLSGRKKVTRATAEERIRGLAPFNQSVWQDELETEEMGPRNVSDLIKSAFTDASNTSYPGLEVDKSPELDRWWKDFRSTSLRTQQKQSELPVSKETLYPTEKDAAGLEGDDEFQVQSTPPRLKSTTHGAPKKTDVATVDTPTDDEEDCVMPSKNAEPALSDRQRQSETTTRSSQFDVIGGKQKLVSPLSPSLPLRSNTAERPVDDIETASEASDDNDDATAELPESSSVPSPKSPPVASGSKKGGLGRIGGRAVNSQPLGKDEPVAKPSNADATSHKKLGTIGGRVSKSINLDRDDRGRVITNSDKSSVEQRLRETSEERANRKREELKRELERKAAAGPAKKKRRF